MTDMNFHGIKALDKYCLFDFPPKDGKYRKGVQVVYQCSYIKDQLALIMVDSEKDSAFKLNVKDMAKSPQFLSLLNGEDRALVEQLSKLTTGENSLLRAEEAAHAFNDFMSMNWDQAISDHASDSDNWKPKKHQNYFTTWLEVKKNGKRIDYQLETFPSPKQALHYLNNHHRLIEGKMFIVTGMSF